MRIEVSTPEARFTDQTRAYAEFRVFSTLARFSDVVDHARVSLTPALPGGQLTCAVSVTLADTTRVRISARGRHAYDAINRAALRLGDALQRHARVALTS